MDFLDPNKKRKHIRRLYVGYALMAILLGMVTTLIVALVFGYNFNLFTGEIKRNGLIFIDSRPGGAEVIVNGKKRGNADIRMLAPEGEYTIQLRSPGYRDWHRSLVMSGGKVERLVYPFLFPNEFSQTDVRLYQKTPDFATQSPDRRWVVVRVPGTAGDFEIFDLDLGLVVPVKFSLPESVIDPKIKNHKYTLAEWSNNNRHFVVKHSYGDKSEYLLIDREDPGNTRNLTKLFKIPIGELVLRDKKFDHYYLHNKSTLALRTASLNDPGKAPIVLENILEFKPHGNDELAYIQKSSKPGTILAKTRINGEDYELREMPAENNYLLDIARYDGKWYVVAGAHSESKTYVYQNPSETIKAGAEPIPVAIIRLEDPRFLSFSANTQFISVQSGSEFMVFNVEDKEYYRYDTGLDVAKTTKATWMDGHRLTLIDKTNNLNVFEFNGLNQHELIKVHNGFQQFFSTDYEAIFTLSPSVDVGGLSAFVRSSLEVTTENN